MSSFMVGKSLIPKDLHITMLPYRDPTYYTCMTSINIVSQDSPMCIS